MSFPPQRQTHKRDEWKYITHKAQAKKGHIVPSAHIPVAKASHMPAELNTHETGAHAVSSGEDCRVTWQRKLIQEGEQWGIVMRLTTGTCGHVWAHGGVQAQCRVLSGHDCVEASRRCCLVGSLLTLFFNEKVWLLQAGYSSSH